MKKLNQQGAIPFIIIIAGVIITLAFLVTIFRLNLFGGPKSKPAPPSSQINSSNSLAQLPSPTIQASPNSNQENEDNGSDFDEEGDNIKASDLDGDS